MKRPFRIKSSLVQSFVKLLSWLPDKLVLASLCRLDNWIYYLLGKLATGANQGIHPKHRYMRYHDFFIQRIRPQSTVLDIGCGNGVVAIEVAEKTKASVTAIDSDPDRIAEARRRDASKQVEFRVGDALKELPNRSFDTVILSNVLEHLPGRASFLQTLVQTLQPARLLIRVPLIDRDWVVALKQELGVEWRLDPTHQIEYTEAVFREEMNEAHLTVAHLEIHWGEIWAEVLPANLEKPCA